MVRTPSSRSDQSTGPPPSYPAAAGKVEARKSRGGQHQGGAACPQLAQSYRPSRHDFQHQHRRQSMRQAPTGARLAAKAGKAARD
jgi:hypothetical protein